MAEAEIVVQGYARADAGATFAAIVPIELTHVFTGLGPLPAVVGNREQTGAWDHVGATRVVELSDGSEASERSPRMSRQATSPTASQTTWA
jgi:hypothetical protein